jgi:hypothetical protein
MTRFRSSCREVTGELAENPIEFVLVAHVVFPNPKHGHAVGSKRAIDAPSPTDVTFYLSNPIWPIALRQSQAAFATVPETPVNE